MAVTQQLARLLPAQLVACRNSADELDLLCSFKLRPGSDHLDLDWAPAPLVRAFELARLDEPTVVALRRSLDGDIVAAQTSVGLSAFDGHPRRYLHRHLVALQDFYAHAARQHLAMALWWD